jgi:hypothetical protein
VENTEEVLSIVEEHKHWCEVHTIGIGGGVCKDLVTGLSVCTGGIYTFVDDGDG